MHHHGAGLRRLLTAASVAEDEQNHLIAILAEPSADSRTLEDAERALIAYADKLTRAPAAVTAADIEALRAAGFDDRGIHDACAIIAYFAFVNRIADGLGVELE